MPRRRDPRPPAALELKSIRLTGITVILNSADFDALKTHIDTLFAATDDFFGGEVAVFDCARLAADSAVPDWVWLVGQLRQRGLYPYAVHNASPAVANAARAAGLAVVSQGDAPKLADNPASRVAAASAQTDSAAAPAPVAVAATQPELDLAASAPASTADHDALADPDTAPDPDSAPDAGIAPRQGAARSDVPVAPVPTVILDKPLRSGQRVYAQGGDLIVLAVVNPGAEVIADGSIHVYAPLKGRALAGASGDTSARIFTSRFEAELVSIAGVYRTFDAAPDAAVHQRPAQIRLATANQLEVTPL